MNRNSFRSAVLSALMVVLTSSAFSQQAALWSGQVQCQLAVQSQGYVHQEIQTWTLTGAAPAQQGAMQVYPATWSGTGQGGAQRAQGAQVMAAQWTSSVPGMNAPIAIFARASDNRLMIKPWHSQLSVFGATNSVRQVGSAQTSTAYTAYEWPFPVIEDAPTSTNVSGTGTVQVSGNSAPVPSANATGIATCQWQFTKGESTVAKEMPPVPITNIPSTSVTNGVPNIPTSTIAPMPAPPGGASATSQANSANTAQVMTPAVSPQLVTTNAANPQVASVLKPPPPPAGFKATAWDLGAVHFEWQPVAGAAKYRLDGPGLDPAGVYISAPATNATANHIPPGANSWKLASVNLEGMWDKSNEATASAMVRYAPTHSPPWLTKPNGTGSAALTLAHYLSLCNQCIPGANFKDVMRALGLPFNLVGEDPCLVGNTWDWDCGDPWMNPWADGQAAVYINVTEFENSTRVTGCWPVGQPNGRIICYTKTSDHGLQVIVKQTDYSWFLSFTASDPNLLPFDWSTYEGTQLAPMSFDQRVASAYKLTDQVTFDSEGTKYPPHACLACHGGKFNPSGVTGATLLPIDPGLVKPTSLHIGDWSSQTDLAFDTGTVRKLNAVLMSTGPSAAVTRYLSGLYGIDPRVATGTGDPNYVPQGWKQQANTYTTGIRPYCVMCHLATPSNLDFTIPNNFNQSKDLIYAAICSGHSMPHAEAPYKAFWTKDTGPFFLPGWLINQLGHQSCP